MYQYQKRIIMDSLVKSDQNMLFVISKEIIWRNGCWFQNKIQCLSKILFSLLHAHFTNCFPSILVKMSYGSLNSQKILSAENGYLQFQVLLYEIQIFLLIFVKNNNSALDRDQANKCNVYHKYFLVFRSQTTSKLSHFY